MSVDPHLSDRFGRRFPYLRLSLTDVCNFSCTYCLPDGYQQTDRTSFMTQPEILRLVRAFAALGVWKIRLTGGEPTIRKDFTQIAQQISAIGGIKQLAFTTNGYRLADRAQEFYQAGLRAINVSIDTLDPTRFKSITGHDRLYEILDGLEACLDAGFEAVKVNAVLLKGLNDADLDRFIEFVQKRSVSVRFIELMRTGDNQEYFQKHHLPGTLVTERLLKLGWHQKPRDEAAGPAIEFAHDDSKGRIGLIAPYSKDFCKSCNRLRVSAKGDLHLCLFGDGGHALRPLLQDDSQQDALMDEIMRLMNFKRSAHFLHDGNSGIRQHLASIGG